MVSITQVTPSEPAPRPELQPGDIANCGRCGDSHPVDELDWQVFKNPIIGVVRFGGVNGEGQFTHWAMCPTNYEPILFWRGKRADA
jgi:hypothetical protein